MNILELPLRNVDVTMADLTSAGDDLRVADVACNHEPLAITLKGYVEGDVNTRYTPASFVMELDPFSIENLQELEKVYARKHPDQMRGYIFRSCIIDNKYIRIKLKTNKTGRMFNFSCNDRNFAPNNMTLYNGNLVEVTVDPKFYFSKNFYGIFLPLGNLHIFASE